VAVLLTGDNRDKFSWRSVATDTLTNSIVEAFDSKEARMSPNYTSFGNSFARNVSKNALHSAIEERIYDNRQGHQFDLGSAVTSSLGQTLGDQLVKNYTVDTKVKQPQASYLFGDASDRDVGNVLGNLGDAAADAWGYLNGPDDSLAVTNANALVSRRGKT
jgi:hypothetical protein